MKTKALPFMSVEFISNPEAVGSSKALEIMQAIWGEPSATGKRDGSQIRAYRGLRFAGIRSKVATTTKAFEDADFGLCPSQDMTDPMSRIVIGVIDKKVSGIFDVTPNVGIRDMAISFSVGIEGTELLAHDCDCSEESLR